MESLIDMLDGKTIDKFGFNKSVTIDGPITHEWITIYNVLDYTDPEFDEQLTFSEKELTDLVWFLMKIMGIKEDE